MPPPRTRLQAEPIRAHAALVTLPLGVLQQGRVQFEPPLPEYKQTAIQGLAMGTENRVAMLFNKVGGWVEGRNGGVWGMGGG